MKTKKRKYLEKGNACHSRRRLRSDFRKHVKVTFVQKGITITSMPLISEIDVCFHLHFSRITLTTWC